MWFWERWVGVFVFWKVVWLRRDGGGWEKEGGRRR